GDDLQGRLDIQASKIREAFVDRLQTYSDALFHLSAFISQSGLKDKNEFQRLVAEMKIFNHYPGLSAISASVVFQHKDLEKIEALLRKNYPEVKIFPRRSLEPTDLQSAIL